MKEKKRRLVCLWDKNKLQWVWWAELLQSGFCSSSHAFRRFTEDGFTTYKIRLSEKGQRTGHIPS